MALPGVFCLEGEWDRDLRARDSVEPILRLLEYLGVAKAIHRDVATGQEMGYYLSKWGQKGYADYQVLYLASHGEAGELQLGKDTIKLDQLGGWLAGKCQQRVVFFGSCLTLDLSEDELKAFAQVTGAKAVIGYNKQVDWLECAAFELLLLERILRGNRTDAFYRHLHHDHGAFAAQLGLVVATKTAVQHAAGVARELFIA